MKKKTFDAELIEGHKGVTVVPTFGVGHAQQIIIVGDRAGGPTAPPSPPPTFDEVLQSPSRSSQLDGGQWIWEPTIAAEGLVLTDRSAFSRGSHRRPVRPGPCQVGPYWREGRTGLNHLQFFDCAPW